MSEKSKPIAVTAAEVPVRIKPSAYPEPFASRMAGRDKHPLGDLFGLTNFGVNLTRLAPSAVSALRHAHTKQDEFVYILQGRPTLHTDEGRTQLSLRDRSRVVPRSDSACVFTKRFLRSENAGFPTSRRVIARMMLDTPCWVSNE